MSHNVVLGSIVTLFRDPNSGNTGHPCFDQTLMKGRGFYRRRPCLCRHRIGSVESQAQPASKGRIQYICLCSAAADLVGPWEGRRRIGKYGPRWATNSSLLVRLVHRRPQVCPKPPSDLRSTRRCSTVYRKFLTEKMRTRLFKTVPLCKKPTVARESGIPLGNLVSAQERWTVIGVRSFS